jgi:hypothetical protein
MSVEVRFDDLHDAITRQLRTAKEEVRIAVAWISFKLYTPILLDLRARGVDIVVYCADQPSNRKQAKHITALQSAGVTVRLYRMPGKTNHMHHKFAVIDRQTVINGSFNWSENAVKSLENLLILRDEPEAVTLFLAEFAKLAALDSHAIRALQSAKKCAQPKCEGRLANILVLSPNPMEMTFEIWGDLVQVCSVCGEDSFTVLQQGVQDTSLFTHLSSHELIDSSLPVRPQKARFDLQRDLYLTGHQVGEHQLHAIGIVGSQDYPNGESLPVTRIIWKNKFVEKYVPDEYSTSFDVNYSG